MLTLLFCIQSDSDLGLFVPSRLLWRQEAEEPARGGKKQRGRERERERREWRTHGIIVEEGKAQECGAERRPYPREETNLWFLWFINTINRTNGKSVR